MFTIIGMIAGAVCIFLLTFGFVALKKMKDGILTTGRKAANLLLVNLILGIFLLCMSN